MRHLVVLNQIKKEKGFTLFEVIVVVVIMGVTAVVFARLLAITNCLHLMAHNAIIRHEGKTPSHS
jgi:prepilin-type N-terminal cleavage/methylation domain-containing protein